jgi:hypothetical protein
LRLIPDSGALQIVGRTRTVVLLASILFLANVAGCAPESKQVLAGRSSQTERAERAEESELVRSLVALAYSALDARELSLAEGRFRRALEIAPGSSAARTGLGRVALLRGDRVAARDWFEAAVGSDARSVRARVALAELESEERGQSRASQLLAEAIAEAPLDPEAHAAYARLSGPAPRAPVRQTASAARELARAHPYDLWSALQWARLALNEAPSSTAAAEASQALAELAGRLWLADVDRRSAEQALRLLHRHHPAWRERRVVWVHVYADETVSGQVGWRMRLRGLWRGQSEGVGALLETSFLPASITRFSARSADSRLASVQVAWGREVGHWPGEGILAAFTERQAPRRGTHQLGVADLMGRRLIVRLAPRETESRTLSHEVLHLYGAVHIRDEVDSLMNPSAGSTVLDAANYRIVRLQRDRRFRGGGFAQNSFPFVDLEELADAYRQLLRVNLAFRALGIERALDAAETSRYHGADLARKEVALDDHLGDVASFVASLFIYQDRLVQAAYFLDGAAHLYGLRTRRGAAAREHFDNVYRVLQARGAVP